MKKNIARLVALAAFGTLALSAYAYELKNVQVTGAFWGPRPSMTFQYQGRQLQGNFIGTDFYAMRNGQRVPLTQAQAALLIHPGSRMNLRVETGRNGIIAILIGLLLPE